MKKILVFTVCAVVLLTAFSLFACSSGEETYSCSCVENGEDVLYTLSFSGENDLTLSREANGETITYSGTYVLVSENVYRVVLTASSDGSVPADLSSLTITIADGAFSFVQTPTSDPAPQVEPVSTLDRPDPTDDSLSPSSGDSSDEQTPRVEPTPTDPVDDPSPNIEPSHDEPGDPQSEGDEKPIPPQDGTDSPSEPQDEEPTEPTSQPAHRLDGAYERTVERESGGDEKYSFEIVREQLLFLNGEEYALTDRTRKTERYQVEARYDDAYLLVHFLVAKREDLQSPEDNGFTKENDLLYLCESEGKRERIELVAPDAGSDTFTGTYVVVTTTETKRSGRFSPGEEENTLLLENTVIRLSIQTSSFTTEETNLPSATYNVVGWFDNVWKTLSLPDKELQIEQYLDYSFSGYEISGSVFQTLDYLLPEETAYCLYKKGDLTVEPTTLTVGEYTVYTVKNGVVSSLSEEVPALCDPSYACRVAVAPTLLNEGESVYAHEKYGSFTVVTDKLTEQTFVCDGVEYTVVMTETGAELTFDGETHDCSAVVTENEIDLSFQTSSATSYVGAASLSGVTFIFAPYDARSSLAPSDAPSDGSYFAVESGYAIVWDDGERCLSDGENVTEIGEIGYDDEREFFVGTTYSVSLVNGKVYFVEGEGQKGDLPPCAEVDLPDDAPAFLVKDKLILTDGTFTLGETTGTFQTEDGILVLTVSAPTERTFVYTLSDGNVSFVEKAD